MKLKYRDEVYRLGIRARLQELETEAQALQREAPELCLSETPILILRPETRNGNWGGARVVSARTVSAPGAHTARMLAQRTQTKALLDWVAAKTFRSVDDVRRHGTDMRMIYQLTHNGYLLRKGQIVTRTRKAFTVDKSVAERERRHERERQHAAKPAKKKSARGPAPKKNGGYTVKKDAQRQKTADYLAQYDSAPKLIPSAALGAYVRRGYLKAQGDGYVRTAKEFVVHA